MNTLTKLSFVRLKRAKHSYNPLLPCVLRFPLFCTLKSARCTSLAVNIFSLLRDDLVRSLPFCARSPFRFRSPLFANHSRFSTFFYALPRYSYGGEGGYHTVSKVAPRTSDGSPGCCERSAFSLCYQYLHSSLARNLPRLSRDMRLRRRGFWL